MRITVDIDEKDLQETMTQLVASRFYGEYSNPDKRLLQKAVEKAVKDVIYAEKENIIERCVNRASAEIARKALPVLTKKLLDE